MILQPTLHGLVIVLYVATIFAYSLQLIFGDPALGRWALRILWGGFLIQSGILIAQHIPPTHRFTHGEADFYYAASWLILLIYLGLKRFRIWGILLVPVATILMIMALTHPPTYHLGDRIAANPWALIHFLFMSLAFALFVVSFIVGISFLLQRRSLKSRRPGIFSRWLPPLEVADDVHAKSSALGFMLLSAGMLSGAVLSKQTLGLFFAGDPRQIAAVLIWSIYAVFLNIRVRAGWRGRKGILLSVLGFAVVVLAFLTMQHRV